jgi:hypothetical protein
MLVAHNEMALRRLKIFQSISFSASTMKKQAGSLGVTGRHSYFMNLALLPGWSNILLNNLNFLRVLPCQQELQQS